MRLIAFGCSNTFGQALPDIWKIPNLNRDTYSSSKYAWPQILADKLNLECINYAKTGASNKEIWNIILNVNLHKTDIIVILWTYPHGRHAIITKNGVEFLQVLSPNPRFKKKNDAYFKYIYDGYDAILGTYLRINHIGNFLKDKVKLVKQYHLQNWALPYKAVEPSWNEINLLETAKIGTKYDIDKALDNSHSGPESHKVFATEIYNEIKDEIT